MVRRLFKRLSAIRENTEDRLSSVPHDHTDEAPPSYTQHYGEDDKYPADKKHSGDYYPQDKKISDEKRDTNEEDSDDDDSADERSTASPDLWENKDASFDPEYVSGDCVIISSDGVWFLVPSFYLLGAGPGFREILCKPGSSKSTQLRLELKDKELETAVIVRDFLNLLVKDKIFHINAPKQEEYSVQFVRAVTFALFLKKHNCPVAMRSYVALVREALGKKATAQTFSPAGAFTIGAAIDDDGLCVAALAADRWTWKNQTTPEGKKDTVWYDPRHWPWIMYLLIPIDYQYALAHAFGEIGPTGSIADSFLTWLRGARNRPEVERRRPKALPV